jgi:hypothetical protein
MKRVLFCALWALGSFLLFASGANAHTYSYACTHTAGELQLRLNAQNPWTSTDGGAGTSAKPISGDIVEMDGTTNGVICLGDIFVNTTGLVFTNHTNTTFVNADGMDGMFEVSGAHITIKGIVLSCSTCSPSTTNTTGLSTFGEDGALLLHDGAVVAFLNANIEGSLTAGAFLTRGASLSATSADISANGQSGLSGPFSSGIFAESGSSVRLGTPSGTLPVTVAGNGKSGGGCPGFGILLTQNASLDSFAATIGGAGTASDDTSQNTCGQILMETGSSARLEGNTITQTTANVPAIQALASSSFITTANAVPTNTTISAGNNGAILLGGAASAVLNSSAVSSTGTGQATVEASASSTFVLAGGNNVSNATTGGIVFQMDHSSSIVQIPAHQFGFTDTADSLTGSAFIQVQSSADLGIGLISAAPSLTWSVPSGDCILVQQNSSFRLSGGIAITGAPAATCVLNGNNTSTTIVIQQESNAFFNLGHGGTLAISGGGGVSCVFTSFPNAHVNGKGNISPAGAQPVMIGSWSAANTATSPGCLGP